MIAALILAAVLTAADGPATIRFTLPCFDPVACQPESSWKVPTGDQYLEVVVYASRDSLLPPVLWNHICSWGIRGRVCGDTIRILRDWPAPVDSEWRCVALRDTSYNESARSNIVRVR